MSKKLLDAFRARAALVLALSRRGYHLVEDEHHGQSYLIASKGKRGFVVLLTQERSVVRGRQTMPPAAPQLDYLKLPRYLACTVAAKTGKLTLCVSPALLQRLQPVEQDDGVTLIARGA